MKKIKDYFKGKIRRHGKKFSLFFLVGIFKTTLTILLSWLFIDVLQIWALLGSTLVVLIEFFLTYLAYLVTKVIKPEFLKYTFATIVFNIAFILLMWFFVDFIGFSGLFSSAIVVGALFALRYYFFNRIGLILYDQK